MIKLKNWDQENEIVKLYNEEILEYLVGRINNGCTVAKKTVNLKDDELIKEIFFDSDNKVDERLIRIILNGKIEEIKNEEKIKPLFELCSQIYADEAEFKDENFTDFYSKNKDKYLNINLTCVKNAIGEVDNTIYPKILKVEDFIKIMLKSLENLKLLFDYKKLTRNIPIKNEEQTLRALLLNCFGTKTCPYCNRNYIISYKKGEKLISTADLDHFYPQKHYPFLALSLYNFVPSCQICNSKMKGKKVMEILYPYNEEYGDNASFRINSDSINKQLGNDGISVKIEVSCQDEELKNKIKNSIEMFEIEKVYSEHQTILKEVQIKKIIYNDDFKSSLTNLINNRFDKNKKNSDLDINKLFLGSTLISDDFNDRTFTKFITDIIKN